MIIKKLLSITHLAFFSFLIVAGYVLERGEFFYPYLRAYMEKKDNMILGIDFSDIEKRALIKAARMMVLADGRVEVSELLAIANESSKIFRGIDDFKYALLESETLDKKAMNYVLSKMNDKKRSMCSAFLLQ